MRQGNAIRYWRKKRGVSQYKLSKLIGLDQPTFSKMENNKCNPTPEQAEKIARYLKVLVTDIYNSEID